MNKKIFIALDTNKFNKATKIVENTNTSKLKIGYKIGLELINSMHGRYFVRKIKNKITGLIEDHIIFMSDLPKTLAAIISPSSAKLPKPTNTPIKQIYDKES